FSFSSYTTPLSSPPFPTRRSSDLHSPFATRHSASSTYGATDEHRTDRATHSRHRGPAGDLQSDREPSSRCGHRRTGSRGGVLGRDRKSTRLNSSHEWISYAVFCLK